MLAHVFSLKKRLVTHFITIFGVDGKNNDILKIETKNKNKKLNMDGLKVLEFAIKRVPETISNVLKKVN